MLLHVLTKNKQKIYVGGGVTTLNVQLDVNQNKLSYLTTFSGNSKTVLKCIIIYTL